MTSAEASGQDSPRALIFHLSPVPASDRTAVVEEGARLLAFLAPDAEPREVQVTAG
jgi:hypothetical protein